MSLVCHILDARILEARWVHRPPGSATPGPLYWIQRGAGVYLPKKPEVLAETMYGCIPVQTFRGILFHPNGPEVLVRHCERGKPCGYVPVLNGETS